MIADPTAFLNATAEEFFVFGALDCGLWIGRWCQEVSGVNPARSLLGRYRTKLGCVRHVNRLGGVLALAERLFEEGAFPRLAAPAPGAVGCVSTVEAGPTMCIMAITGRWVFKGRPTGVVFAGGDVLGAWSPRCLSS